MSKNHEKYQKIIKNVEKKTNQKNYQKKISKNWEKTIKNVEKASKILNNLKKKIITTKKPSKKSMSEKLEKKKSSKI